MVSYFTKIIANGHCVWFKVRGKLLPEWIIISSIKDNQGQINYYVATFEEISERNRLETQVAQSS
jgi:hypothetical protein